MAHRVVWSPRALTDLESLATFIEADSPHFARAVVRRVFSLVQTLARFPRSGRIVPEFEQEDIRELLGL